MKSENNNKKNNSNNHQAFYLYKIESNRMTKAFENILTFSQTSLKSIRSIIIADDS